MRCMGTSKENLYNDVGAQRINVSLANYACSKTKTAILRPLSLFCRFYDLEPGTP